ncbi:MAG: hypothetical protein JXD23_04790 [Spirochaetales bacterium]|nr:hypothetical protein [Spirochaetales bacterium]
MNISVRVCLLLFLLATPSLAQAENLMSQVISSGGIVENDAVRYQLKDEFVKPVKELKPDEYEYPSFDGEPAGRLKIIFTTDAIFFLFMNRTDKGFPEAGKGNYLIKRSRDTLRFESLKIFFRDEGYCYMQVKPRGQESSLDVYLFGRRLYRDVPLPTSLEKLLTAPLSSLLDMTRGRVDWPRLFFHGRRAEDRRVTSVVNSISRELPGVREADDGALDRNGRFVRIADGTPQRGTKGLNCSGFAKWIIDGFYFPVSGALSEIDLLKTKHLDRRGTRWSDVRETERDPYFGLDWTRNLAAALKGARTGDSPDIESCDVRQVPFFDYEEDSGYRMEDLYHVLFFLAVDEPGMAYLGAVNDIYKRDPLLVEYFHVATFFPHFDETGRFRVAVMDQHKDLDVFRFIERYRSEFVHLVRFDTNSDFSLFHIE